MNRTYDTVIIGSGIGGLTAGNFLAREGLSALIIEQDSRPGGCAKSFERDGFRFDAGVHWIAQKKTSAGTEKSARERRSPRILKEDIIVGWLTETPGVFLPQVKERLEELGVEAPNAVLQQK